MRQLSFFKIFHSPPINSVLVNIIFWLKTRCVVLLTYNYPMSRRCNNHLSSENSILTCFYQFLYEKLVCVIIQFSFFFEKQIIRHTCPSSLKRSVHRKSSILHSKIVAHLRINEVNLRNGTSAVFFCWYQVSINQATEKLWTQASWTFSTECLLWKIICKPGEQSD